MNIFKTYHPLVNFIYFVSVIIFSLICMHPLCIAISFISSFSYLILLKSKFTKYIIPFIIVFALSYPVYNHEGMTILMYFPNDNPLTTESIVYGLAKAMSTASALCWFICCTKVLTTDKLMCISGRIHPSASLIFSMTLRFIPRFINRIQKTLQAQKGIGRNTDEGNIYKKTKIWLSVFSMTLTWSAEMSIDISDSMKSRGYGISKRTSFSPYSFKKRDFYSMTTIMLLMSYIIIAFTTDSMDFRYYPNISFCFDATMGFITYFIFCMFPVLTEIYQKTKWKFVISKI